ncbi:hypothetical protein L6R50_15340 [Myxococcota bacterium]|nr:hypothetical protein [Myxococcota bacterium]
MGSIPRLAAAAPLTLAAALAGCGAELRYGDADRLTEAYACPGGEVDVHDPEATVRVFFIPAEDLVAAALAAGVSTEFSFDLPSGEAYLGAVVGEGVVDDDGDPCDGVSGRQGSWHIDRAYAAAGGTAALTVTPDADPAPGGEVLSLALTDVWMVESEGGDLVQLGSLEVPEVAAPP